MLVLVAVVFCGIIAGAAFVAPLLFQKNTVCGGGGSKHDCKHGRKAAPVPRDYESTTGNIVPRWSSARRPYHGHCQNPQLRTYPRLRWKRRRRSRPRRQRLPVPTNCVRMLVVATHILAYMPAGILLIPLLGYIAPIMAAWGALNLLVCSLWGIVNVVVVINAVLISSGAALSNLLQVTGISVASWLMLSIVTWALFLGITLPLCVLINFVRWLLSRLHAGIRVTRIMPALFTSPLTLAWILLTSLPSIRGGELRASDRFLEAISELPPAAVLPLFSSTWVLPLSVGLVVGAFAGSLMLQQALPVAKRTCRRSGPWDRHKPSLTALPQLWGYDPARCDVKIIFEAAQIARPPRIGIHARITCPHPRCAKTKRVKVAKSLFSSGWDFNAACEALKQKIEALHGKCFRKYAIASGHMALFGTSNNTEAREAPITLSQSANAKITALKCENAALRQTVAAYERERKKRISPGFQIDDQKTDTWGKDVAGKHLCNV